MQWHVLRFTSWSFFLAPFASIRFGLACQATEENCGLLKIGAGHFIKKVKEILGLSYELKIDVGAKQFQTLNHY